MTISIGVLTTYPPTACGIATFSYSLVRELLETGADVSVVSMTDRRAGNSPPEVSLEWVRSEPGGEAAAVAELNRQDIVIIEHEFGIYRGHSGADVLRVVHALHVPLITVLHTVVTNPTTTQRNIIERLLAESARIVVMTQAARQRLIDYYHANGSDIVVIAHGAPDVRKLLRSHDVQKTCDRPVVLTWGLLGYGKGIEWAIEAMSLLQDLEPRPHYLVVGQTHPKVVEREGESYRNYLVELVTKRRLNHDVSFDSRYLATADLFQIANSADIVLLPYDSAEQVTSGVLVEAVTLCKPIISTGFPHAVELLASGAGLIVERQNPLAIASAIRRVITEPGLADQMAREARRIAPEQLWSAVARKYLNLALSVAQARQIWEARA